MLYLTYVPKSMPILTNRLDWLMQVWKAKSNIFDQTLGKSILQMAHELVAASSQKKKGSKAWNHYHNCVFSYFYLIMTQQDFTYAKIIKA